LFHNEIRVPLGFFLQLHERLVFRLAQSSIALISNRINCNQLRRHHRQPASEKRACSHVSSRAQWSTSPLVSYNEATKHVFWLFLYFVFFVLSSTRTHSHTRIPHSNKFSALVVTKTLLEWGTEQQEDGTAATTKGESLLR
jgi:hypothetical protein